MPEHLVAHGELWLHPDKRVVETLELGTPAHLGLVTTRHSGLVYASLLVLGGRAGYRFDVPQWEFAALERVICESVDEARVTIQAAALSMAQHGA